MPSGNSELFGAFNKQNVFQRSMFLLLNDQVSHYQFGILRGTSKPVKEELVDKIHE